ncbi:MAG: hybrid sensor histidine kinase/response regulator [Lachnospiraceae bacterium]|nr:hybrid sensor histidine kinase/response regulator [Lachnospiraceae bacterium]
MNKPSNLVSDYFFQLEKEMRIPITTIIGSVERISRESNDPALHEDAVSIRKATDKLLSLTEEVIELVRISRDELEIADEEYSLEDVMLQIRQLIDSQTVKKGIEGNIDISNDLPCRLFGDAPRLERMLKRLLKNAIDVTESGSVGFKATAMPGVMGEVFLRFDISDGGNGVLDDEVASALTGKITAECFDDAAARTFIIKTVASKMGGKLTARAKRGEGCTFTLLIAQKPVGKASFGDRIRMSDPSERTDKQFLARGVRALVVGEKPEVSRNTMNALSRYAIDTDITDDPGEAMELIKRISYDFVFASGAVRTDGQSTLIKDIRKSFDKLPVIEIEPASGASDPAEQELASGSIQIPFTGQTLENLLRSFLPVEKISFMAEHTFEARGIKALEGLGLNSKDAMARFGASEEEYREAVMSMCRVGDTRGSMLMTYLEHKDYKNYVVTIKSILEVTMLIGADELTEKARVLENAAKYGTGPEFSQDSAAFAEEFERMLASVRSVLKSADDGPGSGAIGKEDLLYLIGELRVYLTNYQINEVEEMFFTLAQFAYEDHRIMELIHEAEGHMLGYNYNDVMATLDELVAILEAE